MGGAGTLVVWALTAWSPREGWLGALKYSMVCHAKEKLLLCTLLCAVRALNIADMESALYPMIVGWHLDRVCDLFLHAHRSHPFPPADNLGGSNELFVFEPVTLTWKYIATAENDTAPSPRFGHGFASAGGLVYVLGGASSSGKTMQTPWRIPG